MGRCLCKQRQHDGGTQTYRITSGFATTPTTDADADAGWYTNSDNIVTNRLFTATANKNGTVTTSPLKVENVLPGVVLVNNINGLTADTNTTISKKSSNAGLRYIANAVKNANSDARATYLLNVAAQPAEVAGASATALENTQLLAQSVQDHFSTLNSLERGSDNESDIWARYTHNYTKNDGLALAGLEADYDSNLNAITIGYDFEPTKNYRHGIAFSYGTGSTNATDESDDYNIFGASYYGNIPSTRKNAPSALFDVGYYTTSHDIDGLIDVDPDTHAFTLGATAEWNIDKAKGFSIVPHDGPFHGKRRRPAAHRHLPHAAARRADARRTAGNRRRRGTAAHDPARHPARRHNLRAHPRELRDARAR